MEFCSSAFFKPPILQKADVNGDGFLSADEYYRILKDHGIDCTYEEIMQIMQVADKDHDGKISREEFVGPEKPPKKGLDTDAKAELAFNVFDKNHDGFITKNEMLRGSKNLTKEQVCILFRGIGKVINLCFVFPFLYRKQ